MERNNYIAMCRNTKQKIKNNSNIPKVKWNNNDIIISPEEKRYVPYQYIMDFDYKGNAINIGVIYNLTDGESISCYSDDLPTINIYKDFNCSVYSQTNICRAETLRSEIIKALSNYEKDKAFDLMLKCISQMTDDNDHFYNYCKKIIQTNEKV